MKFNGFQSFALIESKRIYSYLKFIDEFRLMANWLSQNDIKFYVRSYYETPVRFRTSEESVFLNYGTEPKWSKRIKARIDFYIPDPNQELLFKLAWQ